jgi:integrase
LRAALGHAQRSGKIPAVPQIWKPPAPRRRERWLTREEAKRLIQAADKAPHIRLFTILAIATSARESALLQLTWDRVDFDRGVIDLDDPNRPPTPKRRAMVAMNAMARAALEQAKAQARSKFVIEYGGRPVRCIWAGVKAAAERAGLTDVSPHTLRHSAGTWQAMAGVSLLDIANMMGVDITTAARVYLKRTQGHLVDAAAAVNIDIGGTHAPSA